MAGHLKYLGRLGATDRPERADLVNPGQGAAATRQRAPMPRKADAPGAGPARTAEPMAAAFDVRVATRQRPRPTDVEQGLKAAVPRQRPRVGTSANGMARTKPSG